MNNEIANAHIGHRLKLYKRKYIHATSRNTILHGKSKTIDIYNLNHRVNHEMS